MKRIVRILGLAMVITALLVVSIAGTVFAGNGPDVPNGQNGECDGSGPCEECSGPYGPYGPFGAVNSDGGNGKAWID